MVKVGLRVFIHCCLAAAFIFLLIPSTVALATRLGWIATRLGWIACVLLFLVSVLLEEVPEKLARRMAEQHVVHAKRWLRILLGVIIGLGAIPLAAVGVYGFGREVPHIPLNLERVGACLMLFGLGLAFAFVALRLMLVGDDAPLFGRWQSPVAERLTRILAVLGSRGRVSVVGAAFLAAVSLIMILLWWLDGSDELWTYVATLAMAVLLWLRAWKRGRDEP
jgi:hypothetical protein